MKRYLSLLLAALLSLSLFPGIGFAKNSITISIEPVTGAAGETVEVQVYASLALDPGFGLETLTCQIAYDQSAVHLLNVSYGDMLTRLANSMFVDNKDTTGYLLAFMSATGRTEDGETPDGLLMTLTFELLTDRGTQVVMQNGVVSFYNLDKDEQVRGDFSDASGTIDAGSGTDFATPLDTPEPVPPEPRPDNTVLWVGIAIVVLAALGYLILQSVKKKKSGGDASSETNQEE